MKPNEYQCAHCQGIYEKGWSDEESKAEAALYFGKHPDEWKTAQVLVCDDCYTLMFPPMHPKEVERAKKYL